MGFLERAIKRSVSKAVDNAVKKTVRTVVEPKIEKAAATAVNTAADKLTDAAGINRAAEQERRENQAEVSRAASTLGGLMSGINSYATEAAKKMKICPSCGAGAGADVKFCPDCGAKLPEKTVAQGAVCDYCGKQNNIGTKFCSECGAKLPAAVEEENAAKANDEKVLAKWDNLFPNIPKWRCGGRDFNLEQSGTDDHGAPYFDFYARGVTQEMLRNYRNILRENGFREAGEFPLENHVFKMVDGVCYGVNSSEPFCSDEGELSLFFTLSEPKGGFNYVKPEPKKSSLFDLFK